VAAIVSVSAGCGPVAIDYRPMTNAALPSAPAASVALQVRNSRPEERGGLTARVGTIYDHSSGPEGRSLTYHGRAVDTTSPEIVAQTVGAATTDALAHAGVSVRPAAPVLVATVKEYWFDGHPVHTTEIVVSYELMDAGGRSLWHADFRGAASATVLLGSALANTFRDALQEVAGRASEGFRSPGFRAALAHAP
jgi:hypothetical protein